MTVHFRPIQPDDEAFLYEVYASTRFDELAVVDWDDTQKAAFLHMQFAAQHQFYQERYTQTDFLIILCDAVPVGRLYVARWEDEIRIVDIALLPPYRNTGIGTAILRDILAEAAVAHKPVRIHVEKNNPALSLYTRLGFTPIADRGVYWFLEWSPTPSPPGTGQG
jgi:ribosomal protein S18 acetylase RimI-like enzyme